MKKIYILFCSFALIATSISAQFTLPIYEPFILFPGTLGGQNSWTGPTAADQGAQVVDSNLTYTGLAPRNSYAVRVGNQASGAIQSLTYTTQTTKTYASFLIRLGTLPPTLVAASYYFTFGSTTTASASMWAIPNVDGTTFELGFNSIPSTIPSVGNRTNQSFTLGATIMVVMAYTPGASGAGTLSAWVNPSSASLASGATEPTATFTGITGGTIASINNVTIRSGANTRPMIFDELRVGTTWGQVTSTTVALPVSLKDFKLSTNRGLSTISWNSITENNFNKYVVLFSSNGRDFSEVGTVKGNGSNSNYSFNYSHSGECYFKLKMLDLDGSFVYSKVLYANAKSISIKVGPNPFVDRLYITGMPEGTNTAVLYTLSGVTVKTQTVKDSNLTLLLSELPAGKYTVKIFNSGKSLYSSIIGK